MTKNIKDRIQRLLERTTARGCSEAEALTAAQRAADLMREHGIDEIDLEMEEIDSPLRGGRNGVRTPLWALVGQVTNSVLIVQWGGRDGKMLRYIGARPGPQIAGYLHVVLDRAIDRELRLFKQSPRYKRFRKPSSRREVCASFVSGLIDRLASRLLDIFGATTDPDRLRVAVEYCSGKVPDAAEMTFRKPKRVREDAARAGWQRGGHVPINHGVGNSEEPVAAIPERSASV